MAIGRVLLIAGGAKDVLLFRVRPVRQELFPLTKCLYSQLLFLPFFAFFNFYVSPLEKEETYSDGVK